jgi:plasmid stability protein
MASILVRNLDDDVVARLKQIAAERGTSLEQLAREKLAEASHETRHEMKQAWLRRVREIRARTKPGKRTAVQDLRDIRDGRD